LSNNNNNNNKDKEDFTLEKTYFLKTTNDKMGKKNAKF